MTISYGVEQLDTDEGPTLYMVKRFDTGHDLEEEDEVLELEVLDDLMMLRSTDTDAFEVVCRVIEAFLARGPELEAAEA